MSSIFLKFFGGMIPRLGEQHLNVEDRLGKTGFFATSGNQPASGVVMSNPQATEAENCNLYSGELRPLTKPALSHQFCRPGEPCWFVPIVPEQPPVIPPEPPGCIPVVITQQPGVPLAPIGTPATFTVGVNPDATTPVFYQWYEGNVIIPGAVSEVLTVDVTQENAYNAYAVEVSNPCGYEVSIPATVDTTPPEP